MSARGSVHVRRPTYTKPDPDNPGKRKRFTSPNWMYEFFYGNRPYQQAGFRTAGDARRAGEARKQEVQAGLEEDPRKLTVLGLYQIHAARKTTMDVSTQNNFEAAWKRIRKKLPDHWRAKDVDETALLKLVGEWKAEGSAVNTIRLNLAHIRAAMKIAHASRRFPWVPTFPVLKPQRREQTVQPIQLSQIAAKMPAWYHLFLEAAEEVGWRARSELQTRKWEHVDWGPARWLCECEPKRAIDGDDCSACGAGRPGWLELDAASCKTDEPRAFPMTKRLRSILTRARLRAESVERANGRIGCSEYVFVRDDGRPLGDYRKAWQTALRRLGIKKLPGRKGPWSNPVAVHDVRRTTIRRFKKLNVDPEAAKGMVGHSSDKAHATYLAKGVDPELLRETALQLDRVRDQEQAAESNVVQLDLFRQRR